MTKKSFFARVEFLTPLSLSELAARLSTTIGIGLRFDDSGKYDEVPAFIGGKSGLELSLLGAPSDHATRESVLTIRMHTELSFEGLHATTPEFLHKVLVDKNANARGFIDCSIELAKALGTKGFSECSPAA